MVALAGFAGMLLALAAPYLFGQGIKAGEVAERDIMAPRSMAELMHPQSISAPELPKPQLVYFYNVPKWTSNNKSSEEFKALKRQYDKLSSSGSDIARSNASM